MSTGEIWYLGLVLTGFVVFVAMLAYVQRTPKKVTPAQSYGAISNTERRAA